MLHKFSQGGSDRVAAHLARGFTDAGLDVELLVFCQGGEVEAVLSDLLGPGIPVRYFDKVRGPRVWDLIRGLPKLVKWLRSRQPDCLISTANNTAWITAAALWLSGITNCRLFLKTTNPIATSRHKGILRRLRLAGYRIAFRSTEAVWTLSPEESEEMRCEFPEFAHLFHDVVNPYVTPEMLQSTGAAPEPASAPTVLSVARLTSQKRLDRLIAAFALVAHRSARLRILGEGEDRAELTSLVHRLGLADRVGLPGYIGDVAREFHAASVFVLTSDYEGLPAAMLEAMAANCPVLATDSFPCARSFLEQRDGCAIIERDDPSSLAALIDHALAAPRPTGLRAVAERYSVANGVASHLAAMSKPHLEKSDPALSQPLL